MTRSVLVVLTVLTVTWALPSAWAERVLKGQVRLVDSTGDDGPAPGVTVDLTNYGRSTLTDDAGIFVFDLPPNLTFGKSLTFQVQKGIKKQSWRIWDPIGGTFPLPRSLFITVKLLPKGSKKFWTDEFIEYHIAKVAEEAKREVKPTIQSAQQPPKINFGILIKEWATEYGFTPQEAKHQIDQWVEDVKQKQEDYYKLGLAAYAEQEFAKAAELFTTFAERQAVEYRRILAEGESHREKAIQGYRKAGDSHYSQYQFDEALVKFEQALMLVKKAEESELWADMQMDIAGANWAIGVRTEGAAVHQHLHQAEEAYTQAQKRYADLGQIEKQASAEVGIGIVLNALGIRTGGEEGRGLLGEAAAAYRAALEVRTREQLPQEWAMTQNHLGRTLRDQGVRTGGEEGRRLLGEAAAAYRAALEVRTREQLPQEWAMTQNHLGRTLRDQGVRTGGEEGRRWLGEAVTTYRAALEVRTREQLPQEWAMTQNHLANTLGDQGVRTGSEEGRRLLGEAVTAYRAALEVRTRERLPQQWAATQNNLGNRLRDQGIRMEGEEGRELLEQAVAAYRAALKVYTRAQLPQQWAAIQNNLGNTLGDQGVRTGGEDGRRLLGEAAAAYRAALEVRTREQLPQDWAVTQNNLGLTLRDQGVRTGGEEGRRLLGEAVVAYRAALEIRTKESLPPQWAQTQNNLGVTLRDQGIWMEGEEGRELLEQAVVAYRAALEVFTRTQLPQDWAMTQNNLGLTLSDQSIRMEGEEGRELLEQAVAAYRAALEVRTKELLAPQWAQTHKNLAAAAMALEDWEQVLKSYRNALEFYTDYQDAYLNLNRVLHEKLYRFVEAFELNQQWLATHPDDESAKMNFAEAHLTTGRFDKAEQLFLGFLETPQLDVSSAIPLGLLHMAALVGQQEGDAVPARLEELKALMTQQAEDFSVGCSFAGTKHFISQHEAFATSRDWLLPLLDACSGKPRDDMLVAITHAQSQFLAAESSEPVESR